MKRYVWFAALFLVVIAGRVHAQYTVPNANDIRASNCIWVDDQHRRAKAVMGYNVNACGAENPAVLICHGIAECDLTVPTVRGGERQFTAYLTNVMCQSSGGRCRPAQEC